MKPLLLECPAKVNLFLELHGRRDDGFHELATVMLPLSLSDTLRIRPSRNFSVHVQGAKLAGINTVEKAYRVVARHRKIPPVRIDLQKRIPPGAGLGGGSSNAAAAIIALDRMFGLHLNRTGIAAEVGSDVPFFLYGKPALCTGRGEKIHLLRVFRNLHLVLFFPPVEALTREVYAAVRNRGKKPDRGGNDFLHAYMNGPIGDIAKTIFNRLEEPALTRYPELRIWRKKLGPGAHLTGSGSTFFQICSHPKEAQTLAEKKGGLAVSTLSPFPPLP